MISFIRFWLYKRGGSGKHMEAIIKKMGWSRLEKYIGRASINHVIHLIIIYLAVIIKSRNAMAYVFSDGYTKSGLIWLLLSGGSMEILLIIGISCLWLKREKASAIERFICLVIALLLLIGYCCDNVGSFLRIFEREISRALAVCYVFGFYLLLETAVAYAKQIYGHFYLWFEGVRIPFFEFHCFRSSFIMITIFWLPYIVIRFPAGVEWDAYYQIEQALGYKELTAHWPVFSTYIMGFFVRMGKVLLCSYNIGLFALVITQSVAGAAVFAYASLFLKRCKVSDLFIAMYVLIVAVSPLYPGYLTSVVKDALFSVAVLLVVLLMAENLMFHKAGSKYIAVLTVSLIFMSLLRNNGIYIVLFCLVGMLVRYFFKGRQHERSVVAAMVLAIGVYGFYSGIMLPHLGIKQDTVMETFSIPFQQTARYLTKYPEDISEEELLVIDRILDAGQIAQNYNPLLSDPVKATYHGQMSDILPYFKVWFKHFLRHPGCYLDATLCNSYGFFLPDARMGNNALSSGMFIGTVSNDQLQFQEPACLDHAEQLLCKYVCLVENNPITFLFANVGVQILLGISLVFLVLYRRNSEMFILLLPMITSILVCIASPTWWHNGFRYALPIICMNPFLLVLGIMDQNTITEDKAGCRERDKMKKFFNNNGKILD